MNFKSILAACAFAVSLPVAASAAVVQTCDGAINPGPYDVSHSDVYNCDFNTMDAAGQVQLNYFASVTPGAALAANLNLSLLGTLGGATLSWYEADEDGVLGALISSVAASLNGPVVSLSTGFTDLAPDYQSLVFSWEGFSGNLPLDVNIQVAPVPLPAGLLLMGTALAGLGVAGRRKKRNS